MNMPKTINDYCKKCDKHTEHKLKHFKPAATRKMSWGNRENIRKHKKGYGGKAEFTATVKKQNKKPVFLAECAVCKSKHYFVIPKRMKKVELVAKA
ncbi:MAG: 50S ribosomal protein L44e [Candidatus Diapherotrites archaeon]